MSDAHLTAGADAATTAPAPRTPGVPAAPQGPDARGVREAPGRGEHICYVYAVGLGGPAFESAVESVFEDAGRRGLDGAAVRTVCEGGLAALVSSVPVAGFGEEAMKARMEDLDQLEAIARTHHTVVAVASERTTVLPMRLATVYRDDVRVAAMLSERGEEFRALLTRLEGHVEWGVKVYADPRDAAAATPPDATAPASPGRAYLQQRRAHQRNHRHVYRTAGALAARVTELAVNLAAARMVHRPQQGELAAGSGENIANDAYLVAVGRGEEFQAALRDVARDVPGVRVEVTGPWAPYSFATPPASTTTEGSDGS